MKSKTLYSKAEFLNSQGHEEDASIFTSITEDKYKKETTYWCTLKIRDCDRTINLTIDISSPESYKNASYKIDKIISHLTKFKSELKKTYDQRPTAKPASNPGSNNI